MLAKFHFLWAFVIFRNADGMVSLKQQSSRYNDNRRQWISSSVAAAASIVGIKTSRAMDETDSLMDITHHISLKLRIAPTSAAVQGRDELPAEEGVLQLGLYGNAAPETVQNFLRYCVPSEILNEATGEFERQPSLSMAQFWRMEPGVIVEAGKLRGLSEVTVGSTSALEFGKRLYPTGRLSSDELDAVTKARISHDRRGLLTRSSTMSGPDFGITLAAAPQLDGTAAVFGRVLSGGDFLDRVEGISMYVQIIFIPLIAAFMLTIFRGCAVTRTAQRRTVARSLIRYFVLKKVCTRTWLRT